MGLYIQQGSKGLGALLLLGSQGALTPLEIRCPVDCAAVTEGASQFLGVISVQNVCV